MDEQQFRHHADHALSTLNRLLLGAADDYGFDVDFNAGALTIEFEDPPAKFVVSPNAPVRQVWVSALAKSYKLDWDEVEAAFVHTSSKETLKVAQGSDVSVISTELHSTLPFSPAPESGAAPRPLQPAPRGVPGLLRGGLSRVR